MDNTLFIASFPDLSIFDFSKTGIKISTIDNSEHFFNIGLDYIHSYIGSLKNKIGSCDIVFVQPNDKIIKTLCNEGIKCIVLYPSIDSKEEFINSLKETKVDEDYISMISDSWNFLISRLDKRNYEYKFVMDKEDNVLDVLKALLDKREKLGVNKNSIEIGINDDLVDNIFSYCLLTEDELNNGKPKIDSTYCEGIKYDYVFSTDRIAAKKENINKLIDSIKSIDKGISVLSMGVTSDGKKWTNSMDTLEKVMVLGIGSGDLIIPFPREFDNFLKGSAPYVIKRSTFTENASI